MLSNSKDLRNTNFAILDNVADLIRIIDTDNKILYCNTDILDKVTPVVHERKYCSINCEYAKDGHCISNENTENARVTTKEEIIDGKYFSMKASPVFDKNGKVIASVEVFRDMTKERQLEAALIEKNKVMESELLFAKLIQTRILPRKGNFGKVTLDYLYRPSQLLSGDIFDIIEIDEENIGIYIGDVAGHGIAASMMTVFIRQTMQAICYDSLSPSEVLSKLHLRFKEMQLEADKYFTMFYGIYNMVDMEFKYANAGHNSIPFLFDKNSNVTMLENYGFPISNLFEDLQFEEKSIKLYPGESLLMYTDGLIEAKNENGEIYGEDRVKQVIINSTGNLIKDLERDYNEFTTNEQVDDIAILVMDVI